MKVTAETDVLLVRLNDCKVFKKNLKRKPPEQNFILMAIKASMKPLEKKFGSMTNEKRLQEKTNE